MKNEINESSNEKFDSQGAAEEASEVKLHVERSDVSESP